MATHAPVLAYYDDSKPITLTVDSSSKGLGAAIVQEGKTIAYATCALKTAQKSNLALSFLSGSEHLIDFRSAW